jgi:DNA-binding NtrC family response regulator
MQSVNAASGAAKPLAFVVDDEPMLLDLNEATLRSLGFEVRRFRGAELALEEYKKSTSPPALIVTDYSMHRMTGLELVEACRLIHPGQRFLMVSGTVTAAVFENALVKPDEFMPKPYSLDDFAASVRRLTGG